MQALSTLPFMPFNPAWVEQHPAFSADNPRLALGALSLLFAAWRGLPAGSIPSSHAYLVKATGLSLSEVSESYVLLTDGFTIQEDGRLHHDGLAKICSDMTRLYGKEIESYAVASVMAAQDPEQFGMATFEASVARAPRGKTALPKDFSYDMYPGLLDWVVENFGFKAKNQQIWLLTRFKDHCASKDVRSKDFAAEFRGFSDRLINQYNAAPPVPMSEEVAIRGGSPFTRQRPVAGQVHSKGQAAADANLSTLMGAAARSTMGSRS